MTRKLLLFIALCGAGPALAGGTLKKAPTELDLAKAYVVV